VAKISWWLLFVFACGGSNLRQHATAADVSATLLVDLSTQISAAWRDAELAALGASRTQEDAQERVAEVRARYAPLGIAYEAVRLAHAAYVGAILRAHSQGGTLGASAAAELADKWRALLTLASSRGVELAAPPEALLHLGRGPP
jgi:hypothetical protein